MKSSPFVCLSLALFLVFLNHPLASATEVKPVGVGYYEVQETSALAVAPTTNLANHIQSIFTVGPETLQNLLDLLTWNFFDEKIPQAAEAYNRKVHFGTWIVDLHGNSCYNTRAKVLIRDSVEQTVPVPADHCFIESGKWNDPYSGTVFTKAQDIQIDHVVALKNAYISGAFRWSKQQRCLYANYVGNDFHLLSVSGKENMRKLDYAPNKWMPLNPQFRCQHLKNWLSIKMIWNIWMTQEETAAIKKEFAANNCAPAQFKVVQADLDEQRKYIENNLDLCTHSVETDYP